MFMRAKNIYLGKKGQGQGTLLEDFIGHVWERGFYKNNVVLKNEKTSTTKQQPRTRPLHDPKDDAGGWRPQQEPSPLETLPRFHGQEGLRFHLSFPQHFTQSQLQILLAAVPGGGRFGGDAKKGLRQNPPGAAGEEQEEFWPPGCCGQGPCSQMLKYEVLIPSSLEAGLGYQHGQGISGKATQGGMSRIQAQGTASSALLLYF